MEVQAIKVQKLSANRVNIVTKETKRNKGDTSSILIPFAPSIAALLPRSFWNIAVDVRRKSRWWTPDCLVMALGLCNHTLTEAMVYVICPAVVKVAPALLAHCLNRFPASSSSCPNALTGRHEKCGTPLIDKPRQIMDDSHANEGVPGS